MKFKIYDPENMKPILLDCTLRDGGYYNDWDFSSEVINEYLAAMKATQIDVVELGFRFFKNEGFKGACAFTTDDFLRSLKIPSDLIIGVMINGADLYNDIGWQAALEDMFPEASATTPVDLVRIACHFMELPNALSAAKWLVDRGYRVGLNLMQISDRDQAEVEKLGQMASNSCIEVLYFADSMGSMTPVDTARIVGWLRTHWSGPLGIHTHDNIGLALANTLCAQAEGVNWLDATITGMGRGAGNARTEELVIEVAALCGRRANIVPLMSLIRGYFGPMKIKYGWGTNPYYYLAGKHGIHPTYVQEMLVDVRYDEEDILAVLDRLSEVGGKQFSFDALDGALQFYHGKPSGTWAPKTIMKDRDVLILGTGPGVLAHRTAIESYIRRAKPIVLALNTQSEIDNDLIDLRVACHPVRLLADLEMHANLPQPLIAPVSMLPETLQTELKSKELLDFGLVVEEGRFFFHETHCVAPSALVLAYSLAIVTSGRAARIFMAGFDGYVRGDLRNAEVEDLLTIFTEVNSAREIFSITPTRYKTLLSKSVYAI
ncbi:aldolase catalytic domain-containing protein [Alphaproteobacteria bacterium]|nr:aldolase catalytic domain-containing protein [Alphaproteobacteria bacterium]